VAGPSVPRERLVGKARLVAGLAVRRPACEGTGSWPGPRAASRRLRRCQRPCCAASRGVKAEDLWRRCWHRRSLPISTGTLSCCSPRGADDHQRQLLRQTCTPPHPTHGVSPAAGTRHESPPSRWPCRPSRITGTPLNPAARSACCQISWRPAAGACCAGSACLYAGEPGVSGCLRVTVSSSG
jgi:hypothetical protein